MHAITVRPETAEDIRAIDVVHISAFGGEAEAQLVSALRESATYNRELSLVAELGGRIVGHVLLTRVPLRKGGGEECTGIGADVSRAFAESSWNWFRADKCQHQSCKGQGIWRHCGAGPSRVLQTFWFCSGQRLAGEL